MVGCSRWSQAEPKDAELCQLSSDNPPRCLAKMYAFNSTMPTLTYFWTDACEKGKRMVAVSAARMRVYMRGRYSTCSFRLWQLASWKAKSSIYRLEDTCVAEGNTVGPDVYTQLWAIGGSERCVR